MKSVFVSYKREDEVRVARLVRALERHKLWVWWDRGLPGGEPWRANINAALTAAGCVVVVWTEASTGPQGGFVQEEAARGAARKTLVPVLFDKVQPPLGFGEVQAIDLVRWRGSARDPFLKDLVASIQAKLEGRPAPAPQGPMRRLVRRLTVGSLISGLAIVGAAFASNTLNLQNKVCGMPIGHPKVSDICGALGLGARPTRTEREAWEQRLMGSCDALRKHRHGFPEGAYGSEAAAMLSAKRTLTTEHFVTSKRSLNLFVGNDAQPSTSEHLARDDALRRGQEDAERQCADFAATGLFEYRSAEVLTRYWRCTAMQGGWVCGFSGQALCSLDERKLVETEQCGEPIKTVQP